LLIATVLDRPSRILANTPTQNCAWLGEPDRAMRDPALAAHEGPQNFAAGAAVEKES